MGPFQTFNAYSNLYPKPDQNTKNKNNVFFKMKKECYLGVGPDVKFSQTI